MMIQCPSCQFSGRIPDHALDSPHIARCPKCRYRFELLGGPAIGLFPEPIARPDPGASSYELKAIVIDPAEESTDAMGIHHWVGLEDGSAFNGEGSDGRLTHGRASVMPIAAVPGSGVRAPAEVPGDYFRTDPWYSRVLQLWGVVFLAWAAVIVGRGLVLTFWLPLSNEHAEISSSVISVILLVPGAAALFLLVDLGRYVRNLAPPPPRRLTADTPPPVVAAASHDFPAFPWPRMVTGWIRRGRDFRLTDFPADSSAV